MTAPHLVLWILFPAWGLLCLAAAVTGYRFVNAKPWGLDLVAVAGLGLVAGELLLLWVALLLLG